MVVADRELTERVDVAPLRIEPVYALLDRDERRQLEESIERARAILDGRTVWSINSTAAGGGVAEMLRSLLGYVCGAGIDARWHVIRGNEAFFCVTKRLHNFLHGAAGDGGALGDADQQAYRAILEDNAGELTALIRRRDLVVLHDPQTAGLIEPLKATGAFVVWRSHVGAESANDYVHRGWQFLRPFVEAADAYVFSRHAYVPPELDTERARIIPPSIDPLSPKNHDLAPATVAAILQHVGLVSGKPADAHLRAFRRFDGSPARVDHHCDVQSTGPLPSLTTPLVVQVSRWDRLKDPVGVMHGFAEHVAAELDAHLVLAGPTVHAVADDPEGQQVLDEAERAWRGLPHLARSRVHLACLPMGDIEENAAIVNALQRHASVIVQKSLEEGFGLTVTEAMWKVRPLIASGVGGIREQIEDGKSGLLLADPRDLRGFGRLVRQVLTHQDHAASLGRQARERVQRHFLVNRHLNQYSRLLQELLKSR